MARKQALNPDGTAFTFGASVRVERGYPTAPAEELTPPLPPVGGHVPSDAEPEWIVYRKVDVSEDKTTTYDYRFEEAGRFPETEVGEMPEAAVALAEKLANEGE